MPEAPSREVRETASATHWFECLLDMDEDLETEFPETAMVEIDEAPSWEWAGHPSNVPDDVVDRLWGHVQLWGPPAFIRTDQLSRKHRGLDHVKAETRKDVRRIVSGLCEKHVHLMTVPPPEAFLVREWIELDEAFTAFGGLPIAPEYRFFAGPGTGPNDVQVGCCHRYWPRDAMRFSLKKDDDGEPYRDEPDDWEERWEAMWDLVTFEDYKAMAEDAIKAARACANEHAQTWSVDFALAADGDWYLIDMAPASSSWHPEDCPNHEAVRNDQIALVEADASCG